MQLSPRSTRSKRAASPTTGQKRARQAEPAAPAQGAPTAPAPPAPAGAPALSEYEKERLANIAKNHEQLAALGLDLASTRLKPARAPPKPRKPREPLPEASRRSSRLEGGPRKSYAEESLGAASLLPPGTALDVPAARRAPRARRLVDPGAPAVLPPPPPSEEEEVARLQEARALYKEYFVRIKQATGGGRADLKAMSEVGASGLKCCEGRHVGSLPGMPPGTEFHNRAEMQVCGMHRKWLSGIDYRPAKDGEEAVATALVSSGGYEDDEDDGDELWYTGSGGNDLLSSRRQTGAQKLEKGNLALKNNLESGTPVRLLRYVGEVPPERSYSQRLFIYDGLYAVTDYKYEVGARQHGVFKFKLVRCAGQPPLRKEASAKLHQRLVDLAHRDGTAGERHRVS